MCTDQTSQHHGGTVEWEAAPVKSIVGEQTSIAMIADNPVTLASLPRSRVATDSARQAGVAKPELLSKAERDVRFVFSRRRRAHRRRCRRMLGNPDQRCSALLLYPTVQSGFPKCCIHQDRGRDRSCTGKVRRNVTLDRSHGGLHSG